MLPGCGSLGPPVCVCHRPWSFCRTRPSSPSGSPLRAGVVAGVGRARRVGALAARQRVQELGQLRLVLPADGRDAERRERDDVAVELADPVDQPVAAGVADRGRRCRRRRRRGPRSVGCVSGVSFSAAVRAGRSSSALEQVVAPAGPDRVLAGAADQPVVAEVAEDRVVAVGLTVAVRRSRSPGCRLRRSRERSRGRRSGRSSGSTGAAGAGHGRPSIRLPGRSAVGVEQDRAARVVLVVEQELAGRDVAVIDVPGVACRRRSGAMSPGLYGWSSRSGRGRSRS